MPPVDYGQKPSRGPRALIAINVIVLVVGLGLFFALRSGSQAFSLGSSTPKANATNVATDKPLVFTYTGTLGAASNVKITVTPATAGESKVDGNKLTFTPQNQFFSNTTYTIRIAGVTDYRGAPAPNVSLLFTTGQQHSNNTFVDKLPYNTANYTIDRMGDGRIRLTIYNPPADVVQADAFKLMKEKGVDTSKVLVIEARSAQGSSGLVPNSNDVNAD